MRVKEWEELTFFQTPEWMKKANIHSLGSLQRTGIRTKCFMVSLQNVSGRD